METIIFQMTFLLQKYFFLFFPSVAMASPESAQEWIQQTLPQNLRNSNVLITDRIDYIRGQSLPEGITLQDAIEAVLNTDFSE